MNENHIQPLSVNQVIGKIHAAVATQNGDNRIATIRRQTLESIKDLISQKGLLLTEDEKRSCCVMPFIFQELLYDGYGWHNRTASLGRLEEIVEIDVMIWSGGFRREQLSDSEYQQCCQFWSDVIDWRKGKQASFRRNAEGWRFFRIAMLLFGIGLATIGIFIWREGGDYKTYYVLLPAFAVALFYASFGGRR